MNSSKQKKDIFQEVTNSIIEAMEKGAGSWQMPWAGALHMPVNAATGARYKGMNVLSLWCAGQKLESASHYWATYKQWEELGAQVKKGAKGARVMFYKPFEKKVVDDKGNETEETHFIIKGAVVFNAQDVEGWQEPVTEKATGAGAIAAAETFVANTGAVIQHGGHRACYNPMTDKISMPNKEAFRQTDGSSATENYYAVLLHELTHWTGAEKRLNRLEFARFGSPKYAFEELIAELGAAFLCAEIGITQTPRSDHASYLQSWLKALKDDKKAIFKAAKHAQQAVEYLASLQKAAAA